MLDYIRTITLRVNDSQTTEAVVDHGPLMAMAVGIVIVGTLLLGRFPMLDYIRTVASRRRGTENGASAVEYGLLVALIAAVIVLAVFALGGLVKNAFSKTCRDVASGGKVSVASGSTC